jgi:hypothetical protein
MKPPGDNFLHLAPGADSFRQCPSLTPEERRELLHQCSVANLENLRTSKEAGVETRNKTGTGDDDPTLIDEVSA